MTNQRIIIGLLAIMALSMVIYLTASRTAGPEDPQVGKAIFPALDKRLNEVVSASIETANGKVTLERKDGNWVVADRDDYPVDFAKLSALLDGIAGAHYTERKTAKPENFEALGLRAPSEKDSKGALVTIKLQDGKSLALLAGNSGSGRKGTYVRLPEETQAWLSDGELEVAGDVTAWLRPEIVDIDSTRVDRVTMTAAPGKTVTVERAENPSGNYVLKDLPAGRKLRYATIVNTLPRAVSNVRLKDVRPAEGFDWSDAAAAEFRCTDGLVMGVVGKKVDDRYYLAFRPRFEAPAAPAAVPASAAGATTAPAKEAQEAAKAEPAEKAERPDPETEAADLAQALSPWVFEVTEYTYGQFTKTMDDLTEAEQKEAQPEAPSPDE